MNTPVELMRQKIIAARPPESQSKRKSIIYHVRVSQNSNTKWIYLESRKKTRPTVLHTTMSSSVREALKKNKKSVTNVTVAQWVLF